MPKANEFREKAQRYYQLSSLPHSNLSTKYLNNVISSLESIPLQERNDNDYLILSICYFDLADLNDRSPLFERRHFLSDDYRAKIKFYSELDFTGLNKKFASVQSFLNKIEHEYLLAVHHARMTKKSKPERVKPSGELSPLMLMADEVIEMCKLLRKNAALLPPKEAAIMHEEVKKRLEAVIKHLATQPSSENGNKRIDKLNQLIASSMRRAARASHKLQLFDQPALNSSVTSDSKVMAPLEPSAKLALNRR